MNRDSKVGMGCLILFFLPFAGFGTFAAVMAVRAALSGEWGQAGFLSIFALVFGGVGFGYIVVVLRGRVRVSETDRLKAEHPDQRWMWRPKNYKLATPRPHQTTPQHTKAEQLSRSKSRSAFALFGPLCWG